MSTSALIALNAVLDVAVVLMILSVLGLGIRSDARWRSTFASTTERRRGTDRRQSSRPQPVAHERRSDQRRGPLAA